MTNSSLVSPEDQPVTFVELFFDLVFVFSVTQVVGLFHDEVAWSTVLEAILIFWLVWWAWTQFTWTLNAADTTHPLIQLGVLTATGVAFFMAVALPQAFEGRSLLFGAAYILVRLIGLGIYARVASADPAQRAAVRTFSIVSLGGLIAVLIGAYTGGSLQFWLWGAAIVLDVIAAAVGGQLEGWDIRPAHFSERHGLFVIIALGETLIVAASGATGALNVDQLLPVAILAVAITCALWWSYFSHIKHTLEHALAARRGVEQTTLARDVFSLIHFPTLCGVVAYAVAIEEVVAHPDEPLALTGRVALALGLSLFVGGAAIAVWRATRRLLTRRLALIAVVVVAVIGLSGVGAAITLGIALAGLVAVLLIEGRAEGAAGEG